jgi:hypothetical protein
MLVGTMSGTHTSMMVNLNTENGDGNLEVLQQSQMQNEAVLSKNSCPTKSSLAGVLCSFFSFLRHMFFIYIVLCANPDRFVYYLCIQNYNTVFTLMARAILFYNTYISSGDSNFLIHTL